MYVRTPSKDGVCSSVLEALSLGVPVVASENGTRPASVITFRPDDAADLAAKVSEVLEREAEVRRALVTPTIRDTVTDEARLLVTRLEENGCVSCITIGRSGTARRHSRRGNGQGLPGARPRGAGRVTHWRTDEHGHVKTAPLVPH